MSWPVLCYMVEHREEPIANQRAARAGARPGIRELWLPTFLLALFAAQSLWFIGTQSLTYDEPAHIIAGAEAWQQSKFEHWNDHPPLGRLWLTLPLARSRTNFAWEQMPVGFRVIMMRPGPEWMAWHTRPMNTLLGIALGLAIWFASRRLFSAGAANVALALFAFTPSLIAHFSVATTDGIGALFIFLTAFQLVRWRSNPTRKQLVLMGLVLGGLLLSKFYAPPLVLLALGLMLVLKRRGGLASPRRWNWEPALAAFAIALAVLWAGYFFHFSRLKIGDGQVVASFPHRPAKVWATKSGLHLTAMVPAGEFFEGLREVALSNRRGRPAWFLGQIYPKGGIQALLPRRHRVEVADDSVADVFRQPDSGSAKDVPCAGRPADHVLCSLCCIWLSRCSRDTTLASATSCRCILLRCWWPAASGSTRENIAQRWRLSCWRCA